MAQPDPEPKKVDRFDLLRAGAAGAATQTIMKFLDQHTDLPNLGRTSHSGYIDMYGQAAPGAPAQETISKWGSWAYLRRTRAVDASGARIYSLSERIAQGRACIEQAIGDVDRSPDSDRLWDDVEMLLESGKCVMRDNPVLFSLFSDANTTALFGSTRLFPPPPIRSTLRSKLGYLQIIFNGLLCILPTERLLDIAADPPVFVFFVRTRYEDRGMNETLWPVYDAALGSAWPRALFERRIPILRERDAMDVGMEAPTFARVLPSLLSLLRVPAIELLQTQTAFNVCARAVNTYASDRDLAALAARINRDMERGRGVIKGERAVRVRLREWQEGIARNHKRARDLLREMEHAAEHDNLLDLKQIWLQPAERIFGHANDLREDVPMDEIVLRVLCGRELAGLHYETIDLIASDLPRFLHPVVRFVTGSAASNMASLYDHLAPGRWPELLLTKRLPHDHRHFDAFYPYIRVIPAGSYGATLESRLMATPIDLYPAGFDPLELIATRESTKKVYRTLQISGSVVHIDSEDDGYGDERKEAREHFSPQRFALAAYHALHPRPKRAAAQRDLDDEAEEAQRAVDAAARRVQQFEDLASRRDQ